MIVSINTAPCYIINCNKGPEPIYCRPRAKDVFVLSPPKTGTTFTQMVGYCSIYNLLKTGDESRGKDVHIRMHCTCPYSNYFADLFACLCTSLAIFSFTLATHTALYILICLFTGQVCHQLFYPGNLSFDDIYQVSPFLVSHPVLPTPSTCECTRIDCTQIILFFSGDPLR